MDTKSAGIRDQDSAYRRGLVLGLTMAEIMVLIVFTLLLALAAAYAVKTKAIRDNERRIAELSVMERQMGDLLRTGGVGVTVPDIIQRIERQQRQVEALQKEVDRLKPYEVRTRSLEESSRQLTRERDILKESVDRLNAAEAAAKTIEDVIRVIERETGGKTDIQQLAERLISTAAAGREIENLKGQVAQLTTQIRAAGRGNEFPSCWATPDGKTESIFELMIGSNGVEVADRTLPHRAEDKARLPLTHLQYAKELQLSEFQNQLRGLYQWSVEQRCRFYVVIFSSDARVRADLVNAINTYFYPDSRIQMKPRRP